MLLFASTYALIILLAWWMLPTHNTTQTHFDTIIVLGYPALGDGSASPEQIARTLEGVREYKAGVATHILFTGGAAHNAFAESHVMAQTALTQGVPAEAIVEEPQARNTIENIYYSAHIMSEHGWNSAEIVSSPNHLPRAGLVVNEFDKTHPALAIHWRTHAAPWPAEYSIVREVVLDAGEAWHCWLLRFEGLPTSQFLPQH